MHVVAIALAMTGFEKRGIQYKWLFYIHKLYIAIAIYIYIYIYILIHTTIHTYYIVCCTAMYH